MLSIRKASGHKKILVMLFAFVATLFFTANQAHAQMNTNAAGQPWTAVGSSGLIDEANLLDYSKINFTLSANFGTTIKAYYNIVAVPGVARFNDATQATFTVRYRDGDCAGTTARVLLNLYSTSLANGGRTLLGTFDSNTVGMCTANNTFQTQTVIFNGVNFDFLNNAYWIEADLTSNFAGSQGSIGSMQLSEQFIAP